MRAGRLRHRVAIQSPTETQDATTGEAVITWENVWLDSSTELSAVPAEVLTGPGKEFYQSGAEQAETTARITIRWFGGMDPGWRIIWDGKTYNIFSIETDATARFEYRLRCYEGVNEG